MFDFRAFLSKGLVDGVRGGQTRYALTMRAASLVEKGLLDTADLEPLAKALDEREAAEDTQEVTDSGTVGDVQVVALS